MESNYSEWNGAGLCAEGDTAVIDSSFLDNDAVQGGGIYSSAPITIDNTSLEGNFSPGVGAGAYFKSSATITDSYFADNDSGSVGGGIACQSSAGSFCGMTIFDTDIENNSTVIFGGGIWIYGGTVTLSGCSVDGNHVVGDGGGGYVEGGGYLVAIRTDFTDNVSEMKGGGLGLANASMFVTDCNINGNSALEDGGGIYSSGSVTLEHSAIYANEAVNGGGIFSGGAAAQLSLWNSTVSGNVSSNAGGGIFHKGISSQLEHVTVTENEAGGDGGGIFASPSAYGNAILTNTIVGDNIDWSGTAPDIRFFIVTNGNNLFADMLGATFFPIPGDITGVSPDLGALSYNGGVTMNHLPNVTSPVIGQANAAFCPYIDQPRKLRKTYCDIGAVDRL